MEEKRGIRDWMNEGFDKVLLAIRRAKWIPLFLLLAFLLITLGVESIGAKDTILGLSAFCVMGLMLFKKFVA